MPWSMTCNVNSTSGECFSSLILWWTLSWAAGTSLERIFNYISGLSQDSFFLAFSDALFCTFKDTPSGTLENFLFFSFSFFFLFIFFLFFCLFVFSPSLFNRNWKAKFSKIVITRHLWSALVLLLWIELDLEECPILF